jgi:hypothetical protein
VYFTNPLPINGVLCKSKWVNLHKKNEKSRKNVKNGNPKGFIRESLDGREALVYS